MHERPPLDDRVEACRDHTAELRHADGRRAQLHCLVDTGWTCTGGHLWWRRWSSPHYLLEGLWFENNERAEDFVSSGQELAVTLDDFDQRVIIFRGEEWQVHWMDDAASQAFRERHDIDDYRY